MGVYLSISVDKQGAKVQHFTPILVATIMHHLVVFRIPGTIVNKIDSMLMWFFWLNSHAKGLRAYIGRRSKLFTCLEDVGV